MPLADFIHLRVHTAYSLSAGAIKVKELVGLCKANRMPAVAITDTGNLFGALEFATACVEAGVQPIIGCEIALAAREAGEGMRGGRGPARARAGWSCWSRTRLGYRNLLATGQPSLSRRRGNGADPAVSLDRSGGVRRARLTSCLVGGAGGPLGRLIAEGQGPTRLKPRWRARCKAAFLAGSYYRTDPPRHARERRSPRAGLLDLAYRPQPPPSRDQ